MISSVGVFGSSSSFGRMLFQSSRRECSKITRKNCWIV